MSGKVYATISGFVGHAGQSVWLGEGDEHDADAPLVRALPHLFTARPPASVVVAEAKAKKRTPRA